MIKLKNMKLGSKSNFLFFFLFINYISCFADDKIISSELINLEKIKPSFEEIEELNNTNIENELIKNKDKDIKKNKIPSAKLIGLDKITSKTFEITVNIGETTKIGFLEIFIIGFGIFFVYSDNLVPSPPAKITTFIFFFSIFLNSFEFAL